MAESNFIRREQNTDLIETDTGIKMSSERQLVALEASWEINALCVALKNALPKSDDQTHLIVRGLAARIDELSCVIMSAISDTGHATEDLKSRVLLTSSAKQPNPLAHDNPKDTMTAVSGVLGFVQKSMLAMAEQEVTEYSLESVNDGLFPILETCRVALDSHKPVNALADQPASN